MQYIDPVCGKKLRRKEGHAILKHGDSVYHLCCKECKEAFLDDPLHYVPPKMKNIEQN